MTEEEKRRAKPIIFSTPMVEAILDGRKTQTRRVVKRNIVNQFDIDTDDSVYAFVEQATGDSYDPIDVAPYAVGDILWVRETFAKIDHRFGGDLEQGGYAYVYRASENGRTWERETEGWKWKPSIHMPKEAARIFLKVTDVRVERLQNITEEDARAEGCVDTRGFIFSPDNEYAKPPQSARSSYIELWDTLNAKRGYSFESNPFVWVCEFEVTKVFD